jgi:hypothetical protein
MAGEIRRTGISYEAAMGAARRGGSIDFEGRKARVVHLSQTSGTHATLRADRTVYSPNVLERLSEKSQRGLQRSPTGRPKARFDLFRAPYTHQICSRSATRTPFRTVSEKGLFSEVRGSKLSRSGGGLGEGPVQSVLRAGPNALAGYARYQDSLQARTSRNSRISREFLMYTRG